MEVVDILREGVGVALRIGAPLLILSMLVGILVAIFQAVTQIHEQSLSFILKMIVVVAVLQPVSVYADVRVWDMVDWAQLYLFELIFMRMSGFLLFNPLLGRSNLPAMVKTGMALVLSILVFGTAGTGVPQPDTLVELAFRLLLELGIGLVLGFVMRVVFSVVQIGGEVIDTQMGMTMAQIYDASSQANLSVTASLLNILLILDFFAENGHYTLMRLLTTSGELVPYGAAALGDGVYAYVIELFLACMLLAVKLAMPILAAELLGEVGMGVLMKAIPQINAFVINIELKVIIGLLLFFLLLTPINEFLLELESGMLSELGRILRLIGGA